MTSDDQGYNLKIGNEIIERIGSTCKDKYFKFVGVKFELELSIRWYLCKII